MTISLFHLIYSIINALALWLGNLLRLLFASLTGRLIHQLSSLSDHGIENADNNQELRLNDRRDMTDAHPPTIRIACHATPPVPLAIALPPPPPRGGFWVGETIPVSQLCFLCCGDKRAIEESNSDYEESPRDMKPSIQWDAGPLFGPVLRFSVMFFLFFFFLRRHETLCAF